MERQHFDTGRVKNQRRVRLCPSVCPATLGSCAPKRRILGDGRSVYATLLLVQKSLALPSSSSSLYRASPDNPGFPFFIRRRCRLREETNTFEVTTTRQRLEALMESLVKSPFCEIRWSEIRRLRFLVRWPLSRDSGQRDAHPSRQLLRRNRCRRLSSLIPYPVSSELQRFLWNKDTVFHQLVEVIYT